MTDPKKAELSVFVSFLPCVCAECEAVLPRDSWITFGEEKQKICLTCSDLDHLVFLPSGDAALTRRAKKYSKLSAPVLTFNRKRRRNERQGLLVEDKALTRAEEECEADAGDREERRGRAALRRAELDEVFVAEFAKRIREQFPGCPESREQTIAEHACRKYSGRVGRSAAAKTFDTDTVTLAVRAHIRHDETDYDMLLLLGKPKAVARERIAEQVNEVARAWRERT